VDVDSLDARHRSAEEAAHRRSAALDAVASAAKKSKAGGDGADAHDVAFEDRMLLQAQSSWSNSNS
jgi:hypothetical protein